jgi:hypothetical protein
MNQDTFKEEGSSRGFGDGEAAPERRVIHRPHRRRAVGSPEAHAVVGNPDAQKEGMRTWDEKKSIGKG